MRVHLFELLGSPDRKWGVAGVWKRYPVELQDSARLHFPYTSSTYYHVESVLQKRLKRQDHPLLIVSISFYNRSKVLQNAPKGSILQYFRPSLSYRLSLRYLFGNF